MTRRQLFLTIGGIAAVVIVVPVVAGRHAGPQPGMESFQKVRVGMARAEVIATAGGPPGDYRTDDRINTLPEVSLEPDPAAGWRVEAWISDTGAMSVWFGPGDTASRVDIKEVWDLRPQTWSEWWEQFRERNGL